MSIGWRRVIGATVLGLGGVYAGFQADPVVALTTLAAAGASGAGLMWLGIKHRLFKGQPRPAWQITTLGGIGAAVDATTGAEVAPSLVDAAHAALGLSYSAAQSGMQTDNPLLINVRRKVSEMVEFERTLDERVQRRFKKRGSRPHSGCIAERWLTRRVTA